MAIYNHVYWDLSDKPLEEIVSAARQSGSVDYVVLTDDTLLRITQYADAETGAYTLGIRIDPAGGNFRWHCDLFITEIKNNFGEGDCTIKQVYCFDDSSFRMGILVYFVTDIFSAAVTVSWLRAAGNYLHSTSFPYHLYLRRRYQRTILL